MTTSTLPHLDFLFMRHAHSVDNHKGRLPHPHICEGLSELGRQQVLEAVDALKKISFVPEVIISSPLPRARTTAEPIAHALGIEIIDMPEFKEQDLGDWVGRPWHEIEPFFAARTDPPHGETYQDFYSRIKRGLVKLSEVSGRKLVVSHGGVWHGIKALHEDFSTDWPPNASIGHVLMEHGRLNLNPLFVPVGKSLSSLPLTAH